MISKSELFFKSNQMDAALALVKKFHYSHRVPSNIQFVGTFHLAGGLFGDFGEAIAAVCFSIPPTRWSENVLELSRLVRHEDFAVPLSRLISLSCKRLKMERVDLLVSFADYTVSHHGGIYQACSWNYGGQREHRIDGLEINGQFVPGRTCNNLYGTRSPDRLKQQKPSWDITPHFDVGKHFYWKPLHHSGELKAKKLGLQILPYPKPSIERLAQDVFPL